MLCVIMVIGDLKTISKAQAEDKKIQRKMLQKNKTTFANNPTVSVNGVALTVPEYPTETFANTDAYYAKLKHTMMRYKHTTKLLMLKNYLQRNCQKQDSLILM